jgi:hypothetical protein
MFQQHQARTTAATTRDPLDRHDLPILAARTSEALKIKLRKAPRQSRQSHRSAHKQTREERLAEARFLEQLVELGR